MLSASPRLCVTKYVPNASAMSSVRRVASGPVSGELNRFFVVLHVVGVLVPEHGARADVADADRVERIEHAVAEDELVGQRGERLGLPRR